MESISQQIKQQDISVNLIEHDIKELTLHLDQVKITDQNLDQVINQILTLMRLYLIKQGNTNREIEELFKKEIRRDVKNLQKNYKDWKQLALSIGCGALGIVGAGATGLSLGGLGEVDGKIKMVSKFFATIEGVGKATSGVSQAGGSFNQVFSSFNNSDKEALQAVYELHKEQKRLTRSDIERFEQMGEEMRRKSDQISEACYQAILDQVRGMRG